MGKVPSYLKRRQEELAEEKRRAARTPSPVVPSGYRRVDETEQQSTLIMLRSRKDEAEAAQQNLPLKLETIGQKQREKELSEHVENIKRMIGMYSQPVVFVPQDAPALKVAPVAGAGDNRKAPPRAPSRETCPIGQNSRESRAAQSMARRAQQGNALPWEGAPEEGIRIPPTQSHVSGDFLCGMPWENKAEKQAPKTSVQVAAPPGGKSSLVLF